MRKLRAIDGKGKRKNKRKALVRIDQKQAERGEFYWPDGSLIDSEHMLISLMLPPAVREFYRTLEAEVTALCGVRHSRLEAPARWGQQAGSIYLGGQKVAIKRPRVRDVENSREVGLPTYEKFQNPEIFEAQVFRDGLRHISQRDYSQGTQKIGGSFGFGRTTVSKHWKRASHKQLKELNDRSLKELDIIAIFIDGKRFGSLGVVVALGVSSTGKKYTLGIYQANTENAATCLNLLSDLEKRGLPQSGLLFIVDGGSGLNSALEQKYSVHKPKERRALRIRCHFHKWTNIEDALGKGTPDTAKAAALFWAMRDAKDGVEAGAHAEALKRLLKKANASALRSFEEAEPDLLLVHNLGLSARLVSFFSTTNPIESLNSLLEEDLRRVKRWRDSEHFQRWVATAALNNEKRMRKIRGFAGLLALKRAITKLCSVSVVDSKRLAA